MWEERSKECRSTPECTLFKMKITFFHCPVQYVSYAGAKWPSLVCPEINDILQKSSTVLVNMEELTRVNHSGIL